MNNNAQTMMKACVAAAILACAAGCQTAAIKEARAIGEKAQVDANAAQTTANSAMAAANSANSTAAAAKTAADRAQASADKAQGTADQALQASQATKADIDAVNEKLDRMFKRAVSK
jgi:murein lipoprotein